MDKMSLIRTVLLVLALVNQVLTMSGHSPLPIEDQEVENLISTGFITITALWAWWKNNYIGTRGQKQKEVLSRNSLYKP